MNGRFLLAITAVLAAAVEATAQTPYLVKDVDPGPASSNPTLITAAGDRVLFAAGATSELWSSAGTADSTVRIAQPPMIPGGTVVPAVTFRDHAFFNPAANALWKSDGTPAGTYPVMSIPVWEQGTTTGDFGMFIGATAAATGFRPFVVDGRSGQVSLVSPDLVDGSASNYFVNDVAPYRDGFAVTMSFYVWLVDVVRGRTSRVTPCVPPEGFPTAVAAVGERVFVVCSISLKVADGTFATVTPLATGSSGVSPSVRMAVLGDALFFVGQGDGGGLWRSDGTQAGTFALSSIAPALAGRQVYRLTVSNGLLYFLAQPIAGIGVELWRTDGTASGTFLLKTVEPGPGSILDPNLYPVAAAGGVVFAANTAGAGLEPWKSDGTVAGTVALPEINPGPAPSTPAGYVIAGARLFFRADDGVHGKELWAIDLPTGGVTVDDTAVAEGDGPGSEAHFVVRLQSAAASPVIVSYTTVAGSAVAGSDFVAQAGTITFPPGTVEAPIDVAIVGDVAEERDESFDLAVTSATGTFVADGRARAVIVDDDGPRIAVGDASVVEGDAAKTGYPIDFPIVLTTRDGQPTTTDVTVRSSIGFLTATAEDFPPSFGLPAPSTTFPAGTPSGTELTLRAYTGGDAIDEPDETFRLIVDVGPDAVLETPDVIGTIVDNDGVQALPATGLTHGSRLVADLLPPPGSTADEDFYVFEQAPHASYEVVADAVSGDAIPLQLALVEPSGATVAIAQPVGTGGGVSLRWLTASAGGPAQLRVTSPACGSTCGSDDTYRLRAYETTLSAARVNNSGSQIAVAILQNTSSSATVAVVSLWRPDGTLAGRSADLAIGAHGTLVFDTATDFPGFVGSLTVAHNAAYGSLVGKVVSLDAAVGIGFDTPLVVRPR